MVAPNRFRTVDGYAEHDDEILTRRYGRPSSGVIHEARRRADVAEAALRLIEAQTVFAYLEQGWSVREIADETGIAKSEVGRLRKLILDDDGNLTDGWLDVDGSLAESVSAEVARLWARF